jgi:Ca2+-binding EF-hand superfamily protein
MKLFYIFSPAVCALLFSISWDAQAIDERFLSQNLFKTADRDGDGAISAAEGDAFMKENFKVIDANGDGLADKADFLAYYQAYLRPAPPPQGAEMLYKYDLQSKDSDGDGMVSQEEFQEHARKMFKAMDKNGDGLLQPSEAPGRSS